VASLVGRSSAPVIRLPRRDVIQPLLDRPVLNPRLGSAAASIGDDQHHVFHGCSCWLL
jgi:hypothetical protein